MKLIYLAHPFGGQRTNVYKSIDLATKLTMENPDIHVFNAAHYFYQYENVLTEDEIMKRCLDMVGRCDEIWLAFGWLKSKGCTREREMAISLKKRVVYLPNVVYLPDDEHYEHTASEET